MPATSTAKDRRMASNFVEPCCPSQEKALAELQEISPDAPFLALGQTVFWDEPMKAGLALASKRLGYPRRFVAGVHDTDYFAKIPGSKSSNGYKAFPHNDTSTKGLWSAAGEFSALFGSETVVSKEILQSAGLKLSRLARARPGMLDEATEAWGWRGVASLSPSPKVTSETPLAPLFPVLNETLEWAIDLSVNSIAGKDQDHARAVADQLSTIVCDVFESCDCQSLSTFYRRLIPHMYELTAGEPVDLETTATTELLKFNSQTGGLPRFGLANLFIQASTRQVACSAYDAAIQGSEIYPLERFGSGAIPFDLVVPGRGRGTVRLGTKAVVIMTPDPLFISLKKPVQNAQELAEAIERKFGPDCTLVGKAVTLIGSLAAEFVFVFHEGASGYVKYCAELHRALAREGFQLPLHPILRIKFEPWDALDQSSVWFGLPEPFRKPFGVEDLCAPSFAARWRSVAEEQRALLDRLSQLRRPLELIQTLAEKVGGSWENLAVEYEQLHEDLERLNAQVSEIKAKKAIIVEKIRGAKSARVDAEIAKGAHWRERIFEKSPSEADWEERKRLNQIVHDIIESRAKLEKEWRSLQAEQDAVIQSEAIRKVHETRRNIELEIEFKRLKLVREAVICSSGLEKSGHRPSAWWFPMVSPDGSWFRETVRCATYYLEPLI